MLLVHVRAVLEQNLANLKVTVDGTLSHFRYISNEKHTRVCVLCYACVRVCMCNSEVTINGTLREQQKHRKE